MVDIRDMEERLMRAVNLLSSLFQIVLFVFVAVICSSISCWITMEKSHKEALGGKPLKGMLKVFKWGLFKKV